MDILRSACKGTTSRILQKQLLHQENQSFFISPDFPSSHFNFYRIPNMPFGLMKVKEQRTVLSVTVSG